ncbi:hypothetical protein KR044_007845, partial [Drosophila immigrans]
DHKRKKMSLNNHKHELKARSKNWGTNKFRPKPYIRPAAPPVREESKPWQLVKNDIVSDEKELRSAGRFNMDSQQAKEIMKEREKNHRRNVIEAQRNQTTTWEDFRDDDNAAGSSKAKGKNNGKPQGKGTYQGKEQPQAIRNQRITTKDQTQLTSQERNFVRQKLTRIAHQLNSKPINMDMMISDLKRNHLNSKNVNNKFRQ